MPRKITFPDDLFVRMAPGTKARLRRLFGVADSERGDYSAFLRALVMGAIENAERAAGLGPIEAEAESDPPKSP